MTLLIHDAFTRAKVELSEASRRRVCVWSEPAVGIGTALPDLRHFIVVDVLARHLRNCGVQVEHLVACSAKRLEGTFRSFDVALPDHWTLTPLRSDGSLASLLPGDPADELITSSFPLFRRRGPAIESRKYLLTDSSPARVHDLHDADGRLLRPSAFAEADDILDGDAVADTIDDLAKWGISKGAFRFHCLRTHYRRSISFSRRALTGSARAHDALVTVIKRLDGATTPHESSEESAPIEFFTKALDADVNTARAVSFLSVFLHNPNIAAPQKLEVLAYADGLLGLRLRATADSSAERGSDLQLVA